jgi:hypothetical protein
MTEDEVLARSSLRALRTAAHALGVDALTLARRLQDGEIARLMQLLNAASPHVASAGLRHRIEDLLSAVTDGRMPMFEEPETELDWAMETLRQRRQQARQDDAGGEDGSTGNERLGNRRRGGD